MNLWLSSLFLVAGLFLSSSALTSEECQPLLTPLSLVDHDHLYGRWNFIMGYTDNEVFNDILKTTESSWMNVTLSPSSPSDVVITQEDKINGTCMETTVNITISGNRASVSFANMTSEFHVLPSCDGCMVMSINNTARNFDKLLQKMNFDSNVTGEEINIRALYFMGRESTLKSLDLEQVKQQASCLGFSGEPDFFYDPKNDFCDEGEGIKMSF